MALRHHEHIGSFVLSHLIVALMLVFGAEAAQTQRDGLEGTCKAQITKKLQEWSVTSISADVAAWSKSHRKNPTLVRGDFNGDGHLDVALLIQNRAKPVLDYPERAQSSLVAVCLSRPTAVVLHLIDKLYCSDAIEQVRKGRQYYDFEKEKAGTYPLDGVRTICFEKASATYVYDGAGFRRIVDGD